MQSEVRGVSGRLAHETGMSPEQEEAWYKQTNRRDTLAKPSFTCAGTGMQFAVFIGDGGGE
jgi:hypothetical protein